MCSLLPKPHDTNGFSWVSLLATVSILIGDKPNFLLPRSKGLRLSLTSLPHIPCSTSQQIVYLKTYVQNMITSHPIYCYHLAWAGNIRCPGNFSSIKLVSDSRENSPSSHNNLTKTKSNQVISLLKALHLLLFYQIIVQRLSPRPQSLARQTLFASLTAGPLTPPVATATAGSSRGSLPH